MANCNICSKVVAVSLYVRVKPIWDGKGSRWKASKDKHFFFGYWPPESHLANYFRHEKAMGQTYLQPIFESNCSGHTVDEVIEAIEQKCPPMPGMPIMILWNPGSKVTPLLLMETWKQKTEAKLEINNDLRTVKVSDKGSIRSSLLNLFNNAQERVEQSISYPGTSIMRH